VVAVLVMAEEEPHLSQAEAEQPTKALVVVGAQMMVMVEMVALVS
jgi:hypothetical protein